MPYLWCRRQNVARHHGLFDLQPAGDVSLDEAKPSHISDRGGSGISRAPFPNVLTVGDET